MSAAIPSAEVMISPELTRSAMKAMEKDFEKSFKRVANDAQKQIDDAIQDGIVDGAKGGKRRMSHLFRNAGGGMVRGGRAAAGGARAATGSIIALAMAGMFETIDQAAQGSEIIDTMLSDNNSLANLATAQGAGMTPEQYAQFTRTMQKQGGFTEQQDINDIIWDINARIQESINDGEGLLSNFTQYTGAERVNRVLSSVATLDPSEQTQTLDELGFSGEVGQKLLAVLQSMSNNGQLSGEQTYQNFEKANLAQSVTLSQQMQKEAKLSQEFRERQLEQEQEQKRGLLNELDDSKLDSFFAERRRESERVVSLLDRYNENQINAIEAQKGIDTAMAFMAQATNQLIEVAGGISGKVDKISGEMEQLVEQAREKLSTFGF